MRILCALFIFGFLVGCDRQQEKTEAPKGYKVIYGNSIEEYVLPLSKVSYADRAKVEAILEKEKRNPLSYSNSYGYEYSGKAEEYSEARAQMTDWEVAEKCPQNLQRLKNLRYILKQWHIDGAELASEFCLGAPGPVREFYKKRMRTEEFLAKVVLTDKGNGGNHVFSAKKLIESIPGITEYRKVEKFYKNGLQDKGDEYNSRVNFNKDYWNLAADLVRVQEAMSEWSPETAQQLQALLAEQIKDINTLE
ncbi:hypothetical protein EBR11_07465 [bacterium]|nr:hypothetical protein [bacterium]